MSELGKSNLGSNVVLGLSAVASGLLVLWPLAGWLSVRGLETPKYKVKKVLGTATRAFYDRAPAMEIREYPGYLVAEVEVGTSHMRDGTSRGFRQVADFIFGNNMGDGASGTSEQETDPAVLAGKSMKGGKGEKIAMTSPVMIETDNAVLEGHKIKGGKGEKIAMTSPVSMGVGEGGKYSVSFVMPAKYTKETLPKPRNPNIKIREEPPRTLAAYAVRGGPYPTDEIVAERRQKLEAALKEAGITVNPEAKALVYGYYPPFVPRWQNLYEVLLPITGSEEVKKTE